MIQKMRIKIIVVSMGALILLLMAIFITINVFMGQVALNNVDAFLNNVIENDGVIIGPAPRRVHPKGPPGQMPIINGVSLRVTGEGKISEVVFNDEQLSDNELNRYVYDILQVGSLIGNVDDYRYHMKKSETGYIIVFADTTLQNDMLEQLLELSVIIGLFSLGVLFILIIILSRYITKPVEESMDKQKRFIADSSHELKTPLSIVSANLDMLEMEIGCNKRIAAMSDGIKRINKLIHELLLLARTEQKSFSFRPLNLSKVMESTILPLEVIAYEQGNRIETNIEEGVELIGDEEGMRKMISALMENAIKYSKKNTPIKANLYAKGDYKTIEIYNEGIGVTKEQKEKLFDKFYRVDDSRHRETGGHGIGLSIVKNIVDMHKGKIQVESVPNEYIVFKITLHG